MGKKYIIEMEDMMFHKTGESGSETFLWRVKGFNSLVFDRAGIGKLTPYTEPDIEQVRKEAYDQGYYIGYRRYLNKSYEDGIKGSWDAARKIICEMDDEDRMKIFGGDNLDYIFALSPTTVIKKLKAYEQEQEQEEIKVGDEFENGAGQKFVVLKMDGKEIDRYIDSEGKTYVMAEKYRVMRKTGRSFPEIVSVLEKMRGEQE